MCQPVRLAPTLSGAVPSPRSGRTGLLYAATFANFTAFGIFFAAIQLYVADELAASKSAVGLAVGSYSITAVVLRPIVGRGIDRRGRRPFLLGALALLTLTCLAFLVARVVPLVIVLRLLQGAAGAAFYTTAAAVATDLAPLHRRASAIATFSLFLYGGFAAGPTVAEWLIAGPGFAATWLTAAGLGAAGLACAWFLPESAPGRRAPRPPGGAGDPARPARTPHPPPAVPSRRLLHPAAVGPGLVLMTTGMGYASIVGFISLYARDIGMDSSGALYLTFAVTVMCVRLVAGRLADHFGRIAVALPGLTLAAAGLALLAVVRTPAAAFPGVGAFGAGFALIFPALMALTVDRVDDRERGEALGSFTAFMDIGMGGGGYLIGFVADRGGFGAAYGLPAALCLAGAVLLAVLARRDGGAGRPGGSRRGEPGEDPAGFELS